MKRAHLHLIVLTAVLASACASQQAATVPPENTAAPAPAKEEVRKEPRKEAKKEVRKETVVAAPEGDVVGKPAAGSKFARLKLGMTLAQVEKAIGRPTRQWTHPTGKASIPFYFGPDRWVIQYSYKGEGVLTLNSGGEQLLTRIEVNKAE